MSVPTREEVLASIIPNSDQINAEDLLQGPITVTIRDVRRGNSEQLLFLGLVENDRDFRPCLTCRRIIIKTWTEDATCWIGQHVTLYRDPDVVLKGHVVGGVRISHISGIDKPAKFLLPSSRNKKVEIVVDPIKASADDQAYIDEAKQNLADASTLDDLTAIGEILKSKPGTIRVPMKEPYKARLAELKQAASAVGDASD